MYVNADGSDGMSFSRATRYVNIFDASSFNKASSLYKILRARGRQHQQRFLAARADWSTKLVMSAGAVYRPSRRAGGSTTERRARMR